MSRLGCKQSAGALLTTPRRPLSLPSQSFLSRGSQLSTHRPKLVEDKGEEEEGKGKEEEEGEEEPPRAWTEHPILPSTPNVFPSPENIHQTKPLRVHLNSSHPRPICQQIPLVYPQNMSRILLLLISPAPLSQLLSSCLDFGDSLLTN